MDNETNATPYPYIDYKNPNPALSAEALRAAFEGRRPTLPSAESFIAWRKYLEDNATYDEDSFGGPFTLEKPSSIPDVNAVLYETDVTVLQDAYGYVHEYLREFYEKDAPWGTHDDDVLDALERVINLVKIATGYQEIREVVAQSRQQGGRVKHEIKVGRLPVSKDYLFRCSCGVQFRHPLKDCAANAEAPSWVEIYVITDHLVK